MEYTISSRKRADGHLKTGWYNALVSIADPGGSLHCTLRTETDLLLTFDDTTPDLFKKGRILPSVESIKSLISFFDTNITFGDMVLIHCGRGRSRSTSAALIGDYALHDSTSGFEKSEIWVANRLFSSSPKANPNGHMLRLADEIMNTELWQTCHDHFRVKGGYSALP